MGPSLAWWLDAPYALALWTYHQTQELDRRTHWIERMHRLDTADLVALAFNEPHKLVHERRAAIASAARRAPADTAEAVERGRRLMRSLRRRQVMVS